MGKRGAKPQFIDIFCPNSDCKLYGISGKGNIVGNGTYQIKNKRVRKYICRECGRVFNDLLIPSLIIFAKMNLPLYSP
jgi:transposase-like protein